METANGARNERPKNEGSVPNLSSIGTLSSQIAQGIPNEILTTLTSPVMSASYPSTSDTNIFITPAIGRHKFVATLDRSPKKSILKRPHSYGPSTQSVEFDSNIPRYNTRTFSTSNNDEAADLPEDISPRSQQRLTVGFSEKNSVAVFGDTSDDNTTENESEQRLAAAVAAASLAASRIPLPVKSVRQTSILSSEDDTDSPSQPMADSHENTPFDDDDLLTEELESAPKTETQAPENEDDQCSYDSSNTSSLITGKWWFGKDSRFVVHCDKNGCNHRHGKPEGTNVGNYLTPTQQKNKEIAKLRKELKMSRSDVENKEKHLKELRERFKEIEGLMDKSTALREHSRLMQRQREIQEEHKAEKKELMERHEIRVRQLIQEALDARNEAIRKTELLENYAKMKRQHLVDAEVNTDPPPPSPPTLQMTIAASMASSPKPGDKEDDREKLAQQAAVGQETVNQLQAYQNEAIVWRTKAAQLELIVKENLAKTATMEATTMNELNFLKAENERLIEYCHKLEASALTDSIIEGDKVGMLRSMDSIPTPRLASPSSVAHMLASECQSPACGERTRLLNEENKQLIEALEERAAYVRNLEENIVEIKHERAVAESEIEELRSRIDEVFSLAEERNSECEAAQLVVHRLQNEKDQLNQALSFLEERVQAYRNTILDNDLVVRDESSSEWRHGFNDPRFLLMMSKSAQTDMTSDQLQLNEREFVDLREKLKAVQIEFSSQHQSLNDKFSEIEQNLILKTNLVESLSKQLDIAHSDIQSSHDQRQREREVYQARIDSLAKIAERVSFLENDYERLKVEKSQLELKFEDLKQEYEDGLEEALDGSLRKYHEQSTYWQQRLAQTEFAKNQIQANYEKTKKEIEVLKMKNGLDRADLEQRLTSSIDHVTVLNGQLNIPRRDAQCDARPKQNNKYVSCKPNVKEKESQIIKGDLFDETEEKLKLTQAELGTTKRQVQVLQQKLFVTDSSPSPFLDREKLGSVNRSSIPKVTTLEKEPELDEINVEDLKENIAQLEARNAELSAKLRQMEREQQEHKVLEKERIQQLVTEFDNVRKELDEEIMKYENERLKMKERIKVLEKQKEDASRLKSKIRQWNKLDQLLVEPRGSILSDTDESEVDKAIEKLESSISSDPGLQRSASFPTLLVTSADSDSEAETQILSESEIQTPFLSINKKEREALMDELTRLKQKVEQSIRRTVSSRSKTSENSRQPQIQTTDSPLLLKNFSSDLGQVQDELCKILEALEAELPMKRQKSSAKKSFLQGTTAVASEQVKSVKMDKEIVEEMDREMEEVKAELAKTKVNLEEASAELEMYRAETAESIRKRRVDPRFNRSLSSENFEAVKATPQELQKWKDTAGTTFREVNRLRKELRFAQSEVADLKSQIAIWKGELAFFKAQQELEKNGFEKERQELTKSDEKNVEKTPGSGSESIKTKEKEEPVQNQNEAVLLEEIDCLKKRNDQLEQFLKEKNEQLRRQKLLAKQTKSDEAIPEKIDKQSSSKEAILTREIQLYEKKIRDMEQEKEQMYLVMFKKGQQAANFDADQDKKIDEMTEDKIVLKFLHDAFYYYLLNKGNTKEHLHAIMTMLNFTSSQKDEICRRRGNSR